VDVKDGDGRVADPQQRGGYVAQVQDATPLSEAHDESTELDAALWRPPSLQHHGEGALALLRVTPLFVHLSDAQLKKCLRLLHQRSYDAGEVIFREGDKGAGLYIVKRGAVNILIRLADGKDRQVAQLHAGQFFGEMALLESAPRSATAVSSENTELLGLFEPDLEDLMKRDSRLGMRLMWNVAQLLASRLRTMNESVKSASAGRR
jgi:CRP-like cAMP-binding protein